MIDDVITRLEHLVELLEKQQAGMASILKTPLSADIHMIADRVATIAKAIPCWHGQTGTILAGLKNAIRVVEATKRDSLKPPPPAGTKIALVQPPLSPDPEWEARVIDTLKNHELGEKNHKLPDDVLKALKVLSNIADNYNRNHLVDRPPDQIKLYMDRHGKVLLTLADCIAARDALDDHHGTAISPVPALRKTTALAALDQLKKAVEAL